MSFSHGRTFLLGIGFMSVSVVWSIYNTFLPPIYDQIVGSTLIVGLIMTIDNVLALFIQPWIGAKSDRTWTRLGRRFPYILVGMPLAGVFTRRIFTRHRPFARCDCTYEYRHGH